MASTKRGNKPPSRTRYEEQNPSVTARLPLPIYNQAQELRDRGASYADIFTAGVVALSADPEVTEMAWDLYRRRTAEKGMRRALTNLRQGKGIEEALEPLRGL